MKSSCHEYTGSACDGYIDSKKLYFYKANNETVLDGRLHGPISRISSRLSGKCHLIALQAICYRFYPQCNDPVHPKPIKICENECENLSYGECASEFEQANMLTYLQHVIPNCGLKSEEDEESDDSDICIQLKVGEFSYIYI